MTGILFASQRDSIKTNYQTLAADVKQKKALPEMQNLTQTERDLKATSVVRKTVGGNGVANNTNGSGVEDSVGHGGAARETLLADEVSGKTGDVGRGCDANMLA